MAALSIGMQHLIELWLHKSHAIKHGASVKHDWFAAEERRLKLRLIGLVTKDISKLGNFDRIIGLAREIERNRNDIVYGAPLSSDSSLREKIEAYLELKRIIKHSVGDIE